MASKINSKKRKTIKNTIAKGKKISCCVFCKKEFLTSNLTIEHIIPKKYGGTNELNNLVLSCRICNFHRDRADYFEYMKWMDNLVDVKPKGARSGGNRSRLNRRKYEAISIQQRRP